MKTTTPPKSINQLEARMTEAREILDNAIAAAQQLGIADMKDWKGEATLLEHLVESKSALAWAQGVVITKTAELCREQTLRMNGRRTRPETRMARIIREGAEAKNANHLPAENLS